MSGLDKAVGMVRALLGYSDADMEAVRVALENRLLDAKALVHGGALADGRPVPGLAAQHAEVQAMRSELREVRDLVASLAAKSAAKPAGGVGKGKPAKNGQGQQKAGGA